MARIRAARRSRQAGVGTLPRRQFLRRAGAVAGGAASLVLPGMRHASAAGRPSDRRLRTAYRLSTHGRKDCHACKAHGANLFFRTIAVANKGRAHPGCNCGIVPHPILAGIFFRMFARGDVFDLRQAPGQFPGL